MDEATTTGIKLAGAPPRRWRVLVVEDESLIALDLERRLVALGYDVVGVADSHDDALVIFVTAHPDLVLMDVHLRGDGDGIQVADAIAKLGAVPVIFLTAYADDDTVKRAAKSSPYGYLIKPFDDRTLGATMAVALERHAADTRLRVLRNAVENASTGIVLFESRGFARRAVMCNDAFVAMVGYSRAEVLSAAPWVPYIDDEHDTGDRLREALQQRTAYQGNVRGRRQDGGVFWAAVTLSPVPDASGDITHMLAFHTNITRQRQAEEAFWKSQKRLESIVESALDAIITVDQDSKIVVFNAAASRLFGIAADRAVGSPLTRFIPRRTDSGAELPGEAPQTSGRRQRVAVRADGSQFPIEAALSNGPATDGWLYTLIIRDITDKLAAEESSRRFAAELEQRVSERTAELTTAVRSLEEVSAAVSHDLRAPLRRMTGFASILSKNEDVKRNAQATELAQRIGESAQRMDSIISRLIESARLGSTRMELVDLSLDEVVASCIEECQAANGGRAIAWDVAALPPIRGDAVLVRQAVQNLIDNAAKYTGKREVAQIRVGPREEAGMAGLFVEDNGAGFDMRHAEKLFGAFKRLHTESEFPGVGIGLSNVRRIVEMHQGRVWCEAAVDKGATFYMVLPKT